MPSTQLIHVVLGFTTFIVLILGILYSNKDYFENKIERCLAFNTFGSPYCNTMLIINIINNLSELAVANPLEAICILNILWIAFNLRYRY